MIETFRNILSSKHTGHIAIGAACYASFSIMGEWTGLAVLGQPTLIAVGVAGAGLSLTIDQTILSDE